MKEIISFIILLILITALIGSCFGGCETEGGDGVSSCKNCGRGSVYFMGFCKRCYDGFYNYNKKDGFYD